MIITSNYSIENEVGGIINWRLKYVDKRSKGWELQEDHSEVGYFLFKKNITIAFRNLREALLKYLIMPGVNEFSQNSTSIDLFEGWKFMQVFCQKKLQDTQYFLLLNFSRAQN